MFSFGLGGAELLNIDINRIALPIGLTLFAAVIAIRVWAETERRSLADIIDYPGEPSVVPDVGGMSYAKRS